MCYQKSLWLVLAVCFVSIVSGSTEEATLPADGDAWTEVIEWKKGFVKTSGYDAGCHPVGSLSTETSNKKAGNCSIKLTYRFPDNDRSYFVLTYKPPRNLDLTPYKYMKMWIYNPEPSGITFAPYIFTEDSDGNKAGYRSYPTPLSFKGWKLLTFTIDPPAGSKPEKTKFYKNSCSRISIFIANMNKGKSDKDTYILIDNFHFSTTEESPEMLLSKEVSSPPKIDGRLNDKCWKDLPRVTNFIGNKDMQLAGDQTTVSLGYDDKNLYLDFYCNESAMNKIRANIKDRDGMVVMDDSVEIFLDPGLTRTRFYHFMANTKGVRYDTSHMDLEHSSFARDHSFNPSWEVKSSQGKDYWAMEIAIPFKDLYLAGPPSKGEIWGINLSRNDWTGGKIQYSSWVHTGVRAHTPSRFGLVVFGNYKDNLLPKLSSVKKIFSELKGDENVEGITPESIASKIKDIEERLTKPLSTEDWGFLDEKIKGIKRDIIGLKFAGKGIIIWTRTPSTQITPKDFPETGEIINELNISTYINEYEPAAFILTNTTRETIFARVLVNELIDDGTKRMVPPKDMELRVASFVKLYGKEDWIIADALPRINEANLLTLPPDVPIQVWLTFKTKDISPGSYRGKITIKPLYGAPLQDIGINLKVYPLRLSDKPPLKAYMGPVFMNLYRRNLTEETIKAYAKDIAEHKASFCFHLTRQILRWNFGAGHVSLTSENMKPGFERRVRAFKEHGIDTLWLEPYYDDAKHLGFFSPAWKEAMRKWLPDVVNYLKSVGFDYDHLYINVGHEVCGPSAEITAQRAKFFKEVDPNIKLWVIASGSTLEDIKKLAPYVDGFMVYKRVLFQQPETIKFLKSKGKIVTSYTTGGSMKPRSPSGVFRNMGWNAWIHNIDGMNLWTYDYFHADSWMAEPLGNRNYGDASVIYIDSNWPKEPVPSRRWEMFREGIEDYCHLYILKKTIEKAKDKGINTLKAEHLLKRFPKVEIYGYTKEIAEETTKLNAEMPFKTTTPEIEIKENDVIISWETTEPAKGKVYYRKIIEGRDAGSFAKLWSSVEENNFSNKHSVCLTDLDPGSKYIFYISSSNEIGYVVENDNDGKYYPFEI